MSRVYIEKIVGIFQTGASVMTAAMLANKTLILTGLRIFLGTQKQHMLKKMDQPRSILRILITAYIDIQRGSRLIAARIRNQQHIHVIR